MKPRKPLGPLFDELNKQGFNGRLPLYRVVRVDFRAVGQRGLCESLTKTIKIARYLTDEEARGTLLHEMCHIEGGNHGKRFIARLKRLRDAREQWIQEWAQKEIELYENPPSSTIWQEMRDRIDDIALVRPEWKWRDVWRWIGREFGYLEEDLDRRHERIRRRWEKRRQEEIREEARARAIEGGNSHGRD